MKDIRQTAVGLNARGPVGCVGVSVHFDEAQWKRVIAHGQGSIRLYDRSGSPLFRTDTQQSWAKTGSYPPVEGFLSSASGHTGGMARAQPDNSAARFLPQELALPALRQAAAGCKGCRLWQLGTQTVFGEGPESAAVMLVGEQPGDQEDKAGEPFVGPAGRLLDKALAEAEIDRSATYLTNAVKHFKWQARGKRRIHQKPTWAEITACRPWLEAELAVVQPRVLVLLGATAAQSLLGRQFRVTQNRRKVIESDLAEAVTATIHPSAILRGEPEARETEFAAFVDDLRFVASLV
jgi:uracil-DNA glycosylase